MGGTPTSSGIPRTPSFSGVTVLRVDGGLFFAKDPIRLTGGAEALRRIYPTVDAAVRACVDSPEASSS
jgi:hypothetical protein